MQSIKYIFVIRGIFLIHSDNEDELKRRISAFPVGQVTVTKVVWAKITLDLRGVGAIPLHRFATDLQQRYGASCNVSPPSLPYRDRKGIEGFRPTPVSGVYLLSYRLSFPDLYRPGPFPGVLSQPTHSCRGARHFVWRTASFVVVHPRRRSTGHWQSVGGWTPGKRCNFRFPSFPKRRVPLLLEARATGET